MTPEGRTQHLNRCRPVYSHYSLTVTRCIFTVIDETQCCVNIFFRCLDGCENNTQASRPPPGVLDCPVCGKKLKSQKSRSTHLKRCSSDMGVSPAVLLQALQRQAQEVQDVPVVNTEWVFQSYYQTDLNITLNILLLREIDATGQKLFFSIFQCRNY